MEIPEKPTREELREEIELLFVGHHKYYTELCFQIYECGYQGIKEVPLRQVLAKLAVKRAFQAVWACRGLDEKRMEQGQSPRYLKEISLVEHGFCDALDLQVGADNRPLLKAAAESNSALALAQIKNALECFGTQEGFAETLNLRLQKDLVNDTDFSCKLGRTLLPEKPLPQKLIFQSNQGIILYYWLPLRIWAKTADEARFDLIEAAKLNDHTPLSEAGFKQALADTKRRTLRPL